jgi:Ca2+-transporting ATPase
MPVESIPPGLTEAEAAARLAAEGPNELPRPERRSFRRIVFDTLREPMFALLIAAALIYLALGDLKEALVLLVFATGSVSIAVIQESRSERVIDSLRDLTSPRALVIRSGTERRIAGREVVRGDIVVLAEGDRAPADARLLLASDLQTDESLLTGESMPVSKAAPPAAAAAIGRGEDDPSIVYSGSLVVRGHGQGEVIATGKRSRIGRIGLAITHIDPEPPRLQAQVRLLVRNFAAVSLSLSAIAVPLYGLLRGGWLDALLNGVALGMSMLPEEFPLVLTVFMVMGAWRISRARVLTRRIAAIETLGAATVLCADKTGTLTQNRMTIAEFRFGGYVWRPDESAEIPDLWRAPVAIGVLACAAEPFDPMEKAFHVLAEQRLAGRDLYADKTLRWEFGLRPDLLAVANVWQDPAGNLLAAAKGAPEAIAELCRLAAAERAALDLAVDAMAREGMRVLGLARASVPPDFPRPDTPRAFAFEPLGLVGLADPLRPSVPAAVRECRNAGIRVVMITGDYPQTAQAIAAAAGLEVAEIVTGRDLARIDDAELARRVADISVFARIAPEQKLRVVEALKRNGEVVAMTGDGVNDAAALKAAHIGIAMGGRGADVAREAAALVLLDDDFASIVAAVRLGRRIYDNLRKAMAYIIAIHVPIAGLAVTPLLLGLPIILMPLHIAFLEMVVDPVCSIVFEAEGEEADLMRRPPRDPAAALISGGLVAWGLFQGAVMLLLVGAVFAMAIGGGAPADEARSLTFATLVAANVGLVLVNRSTTASFIAAVRRPNPALWWVSSTNAAILAAILLIEPLRRLFRFGPLHGDDLVLTLAVGLLLMAALEVAKRFFRHSRTHPAESHGGGSGNAFPGL